MLNGNKIDGFNLKNCHRDYEVLSQTINFFMYRHSSIYAVNVGAQKQTRGSKNCVNRGYLVVLKGRKIDRIIKQGKWKIAEIETAEIKECLYSLFPHPKL